MIFSNEFMVSLSQSKISD